MPPATQAIIAVNVVVYLLQSAMGPFVELFMLWPLDSGAFAPWQVVTYGFLHDPNGFSHIFFNMFAIYMFGSTLERYYGTRFYVLLYFVSVVTAAITQLGVNEVLGSPYPTLGASGGVFGLLLAFGMQFPQQRIMLLFPPVSMPAWVMVTGYAALELFLGVTQTQAGVAHFAHLGGMLGAFFVIQWRWGRPPFTKRRR
jgi:membrane associated rhomboid family serine protease